MTKTSPDEIDVTQRLRRLRERSKLSMEKIAKSVGLKRGSSYQRYEDPDRFTKPTLPLHLVTALADIFVGKGSPPITREEVLMLAGLSELTAPQLKSLDEHKLVWCVGEVAAGVWREAFEWPRSEWLPVLIPIHDERYPGIQRAALRVRGDSMDQIYPDGSLVIFVRLADIARKPVPGDRVVVLRHRHGTTEGTIKEYARDASKGRWLLPRSSNPAHSAILLDQQKDGGETIDVMGLIVGSQRIE